MKLYLLRHAVAVEREEFQGDDDSLRPLTRDGEKRMRRAAKGMRALGLSYDLILSSPCCRALETARIVAGGFGIRRRLVQNKLLAPGGNRRALIKELAAWRGAPESVLLVGHEPDLGCLIALLVGAGSAPPLKLKKGALCLLEIEKIRQGSCAQLAWLLTARQLALLAG